MVAEGFHSVVRNQIFYLLVWFMYCAYLLTVHHHTNLFEGETIYAADFNSKRVIL